ncbi:MAG: hypothetical protein ACTHK7_17205 [Aureliella sp.]
MWDETERANADAFFECDWQLGNWQLRDESTTLSPERVDEVFDDLDALLEEALA